MRPLALVLALFLFACGGSDATDSEDTTTTTPDLPEGFSTDVYRAIVSDAATRAGVAEAVVAVDTIEQQEFSDAALGCPEEGQFYAQVITPGFRVLVSADGSEYDYRVAENDDSFRWCETPIDSSG